MLPVMNLLISGKSRDLLLAAAAASGSLHIFAQKFVKYNELSMVNYILSHYLDQKKCHLVYHAQIRVMVIYVIFQYSRTFSYIGFYVFILGPPAR